jgi:sn-glycerol 3-phosphate transport system substrate-binding protein
MMKSKFFVTSFALGMSLMLAGANAQEVVLRHRLDGVALDALSSLVLRFNGDAKSKGKVVLQDVRGLDDVRTPPHLALFDPDDEAEMLGTQARLRPMQEVMREAGVNSGSEQFYPQIADAVADAKGRLQSLPLALTMPVLLINRAAWTRAGLGNAALPATWWEVQKVAGAMFDTGSQCPLTSTRFAWIHLENVSVQHGVPVMVKSGANVGVNSLVNVKHLALLASWQKSRYFHYADTDSEAVRRFLSGECAMLTGESSFYATARHIGMEVMAAPLPHYDDVYGVQPDNVLPDGASLFAVAGQPRKESQLAAQFVKFLMQPNVQQEWTRATGYLPMTAAASKAFRESGLPSVLLDAAQKRLTVSAKGSTRSRIGALRSRFRRVLGEEVAFVWTTDRPAKEALDTTVRRVNTPEPVRAAKAAKK